MEGAELRNLHFCVRNDLWDRVNFLYGCISWEVDHALMNDSTSINIWTIQIGLSRLLKREREIRGHEFGKGMVV